QRRGPHQQHRLGGGRPRGRAAEPRRVRRVLPPQTRSLAPAMNATPKLLGSYATPAFDYGDVVFCERRGDVRIVGLSEAPIPWPIGQRLPRGRKRSLVLYGDLAEAVRRESVQAVAYFWGITGQTVTLWRRVLDVSQHNEGTTAL